MFQQALLEQVLKKYDTQAEGLKAVSELLFLNKSNIYRRLSGAIALKPQEIETLAQHYDISLDELVYENSAQSLGTIISGGTQNYSINFILKHLNQLKEISKIPDFSYNYAAIGFTFLYYTRYPELYYFKILQFQRLLWKVDGNFKFDFQQVTEQEKDLLFECQEYLEDFKWVDYYYDGMINLFLQQLIYTYEMGVMNREDVKMVLSVKKQFIKDLEVRVERGTTCFDGSKPNLEVYYNPTPNQGSVGLGRSKTFNYITSVYVPPNYILSHNKKMIAKTEQFFKNIRRKSTKISETGELTRRKLFAYFRKEIRRVERQILG